MWQAPPWRSGSPRIELRLLDGFQLLSDGESFWVPLSVQRLLAFLALHDRPARRVYIAGKLWPDTTDHRALASLRSTLWRAHRCGHQLVTSEGSQLGLRLDVAVDLRQAMGQARRLVDGSAERSELSLDQLSLARPLLPDWYDDWVLIESERYRQLCLHALEALVERLIRIGRCGEAAEAALAAIAGDPLRESAHRSLIMVHLAERNPSEALRQYRLYRAMLREELGLVPSGRMEALVGGLASS